MSHPGSAVPFLYCRLRITAKHSARRETQDPEGDQEHPANDFVAGACTLQRLSPENPPSL